MRRVRGHEIHGEAGEVFMLGKLAQYMLEAFGIQSRRESCLLAAAETLL